MTIAGREVAAGRLEVAFIFLAALTVLGGCAQPSRVSQARALIDSYVARVEPLSDQANQAYWEAATTGDAAKFDQVEALQLQIRRIGSNPSEFAVLKDLREAGRVEDPVVRRQLDMLYNAYLPNQIEPELLAKIVALDTATQERYNNFRGTIEGKKVTMSDIYVILTTEQDCRKRELAWKASKQVGEAIAEDFLELVRLRNAAAESLGFDSYHTLSITAAEQTVEQLDEIFEHLDRLTEAPFARLKHELDRILAKEYGIGVDELMPWHYHDPFFQRTPLVYELDLDAYYQGRDVAELSKVYYVSVDLPVDDILARSDLYDREGKYPHAFSTDIDRKGNVRILCNLQDTERWMETILHELGHAIYSKYHDANEPWLLREPAHSFTTEAIAMLFGRLSRNAAWMQVMLGLSDGQRAEVEAVSAKYLRFQQVLFARWAMVMYHFEKRLYADPDQDLNTLWWDLIERYQLLKRPPDIPNAGWLSKLHFTTAPCYYHNYMLGELLASQLHHAIVDRVLEAESDRDVSYVGDKRIGWYLREQVLGPGARYPWNEMIERATGERLTPKHFVRQFILE